MNSFALFTDVSLNPQRKLGIGGYLLVPVSFLETEPHAIEPSDVLARLEIKSFAETSSTMLEVQTVLWALERLRKKLTGPVGGNLQIYTDSQCVAGLLGRRSGLEQNNFIAKRSGKLIRNALLYRGFYAAHDQLGFQVTKVTGHSRTCTHDTIQRIFSHVDQGVRRALSIWLDSPESQHTPPDSFRAPQSDSKEALHGNDR